ncbi:hypothetical protein GCM10020000_14660 [Streptomyces olivoverticillatus]
MAPPESLDRVRLLIVGGEACPAELVDRFAVPGREMWNTYGPTETTVVACAAQMLPGRTVRIGLPLDGWELAVVDEAGELVPFGAEGELVIAGAGVARYLDPVKDADKFRPSAALESPPRLPHRRPRARRRRRAGLRRPRRRPDQARRTPHRTRRDRRRPQRPARRARRRRRGAHHPRRRAAPGRLRGG